MSSSLKVTLSLAALDLATVALVSHISECKRFVRKGIDRSFWIAEQFKYEQALDELQRAVLTA